MTPSVVMSSPMSATSMLFLPLTISIGFAPYRNSKANLPFGAANHHCLTRLDTTTCFRSQDSASTTDFTRLPA